MSPRKLLTATDIAPYPVPANLSAEMARTEMTLSQLTFRLSERLQIFVHERQVRRYVEEGNEVPWDRLVGFADVFGREPQWFYMDHSA